MVEAIRRDVHALEQAGMPVVIDWHGPMPEHTRKMYAAFGVLVRFVPERRTK